MVVSTRRDENGAVTGWTSWFDFKGRREQAYKGINNDELGLTNLLNAVENTGNVQDFPDLLKELSDDAKDFALNTELSAERIRDWCDGAKEAATVTNSFKGKLTSLGSTLKSIGKQALAVGANMLISAAVSKLIDLAVNAIDQYVNRVQYAQDALDEVQSKWEEINKEQQEASKVMNQYADDYNRLSSGVDTRTGKNLTLSESEYKQYLEANNAIANSALKNIEGVTVGYETAKRFLKGQHVFIVATHTDKSHLHNHIIWNSTALDCQRKFRDFKRSGEAIARLSDTVCVENRLSIVPEPRGKGRHYGAWLGGRREPSRREKMRQAIDDALTQHPADLAELLDLLHKAGWEVKCGKHIALRGAGESRFKRLDSLGEGYTEAALCAILAGKKEHKQRTKCMAIQREPISLLVDIQAKLRAGKGAGYERWAKKFNVKELAKTLNYLSEAGVSDHADLVQRTENATARMTELRDAIRQTETRMTEIGMLETHIFNYLKTKDVYAAYRESGYSRKFAEAHLQELALHRAAKSAFDALGTKKIPSIKALKAEYAELAQQKKLAYQEYRQAREDMRTLLRVRANVETILNDNPKDVPEQTSHRSQDDAER